MVRLTVEVGGHRVLEAADGTEGWQVLTTERPDVVILDVMMPGPSGLDVCRAIRGDARLAGLPVIMLSAGGPEMASDAVAAGATVFVAKPFNPSALLSLVASFSSTQQGGRRATPRPVAGPLGSIAHADGRRTGPPDPPIGARAHQRCPAVPCDPRHRAPTAPRAILAPSRSGIRDGAGRGSQDG